MHREFEILGAYTRLTVSIATASGSIRGACSAARKRPVRPTPSWSTDGTRRDLPSKVTTFLAQGDHLRTVTPGGGGWGDPLERPADLVAADVREGLITAGRAAAVYGVVLTADGTPTAMPPWPAERKCATLGSDRARHRRVGFARGPRPPGAIVGGRDATGPGAGSRQRRSRSTSDPSAGVVPACLRGSRPRSWVPVSSAWSRSVGWASPMARARPLGR